MVEWNKTDKFRKLQSKWYTKLKKSGFEDAENDEVNLKMYSESFFTVRNREDRYGLISVKAKLDYYAQCRQFLQVHKFKNKTYRQIFEMHSEGVGVRRISNKIKKYKHSKVNEIVRELVKVMRGRE